MSTPSVGRPWSIEAIRHLRDSTSCPVCERNTLRDRHCLNCGAELSVDLADELWTASGVAADALTTRQSVLDRVPRRAVTRGIAKSGAASAAVGSSTLQSASADGQRSSATVQSVLAIAGAGLFAVAAIVFTFFNPDLTDAELRSVIVGIITILFLGAAWLLARRSLQFSAEAVGGLGMVFVALDVYAISELTPTGSSPWVFAAIGTLVAGLAMVAISTRARIRSWLWVSLLGLSFVPAMLGYAGGTTVSATVGHLGVAFAALAFLETTPRLAGRFDGRLRAERVALSVAQIAMTALALTQVWFVEPVSNTAYWPTVYWLTVTAVLAAVAVLAVFATRQLARVFWSVLAGAAGVGAVVVLPFALDLGSVGPGAAGLGVWYLTIMAAAGSVALLTLGLLVPRVRTIGRPAYLAGAFAVAGASVLPAVLLSVVIGAAAVLSALSGSVSGAVGVLPTHGVLAVVLGLTAMAAGLAAFALIEGRRSAEQSTRLARATGALATWLAALAGLTLACLPTFPLWLRITIALGLAVGVSLSLAAIPRIRVAPLALRLPLILGVHFAVLLATIVSWTNEGATVWAGTAVVVAIGVVAMAMPSQVRFLHVGAGYAYALVVFSIALTMAELGPIAVQSLTTTLGSIGAIGATFLRKVKTPAWYAVLLVTSVPFLIGVVQVVFERSGWTALSTGLIFLLALTLLVTRRAGLGVGLRMIAAAILVPSLAVVIISLGAQVLVDSASPVTLPVIAAIAAIVLSSTSLIRTALEQRGIGERGATMARIAIEASTLLTGAIAVLLALIRVAAGLQTTFIVLVILGLGGAASAIWAKRRYGWWVAAVSFTGALWCLWALAGIDVLEPYLLPPSVAAAIVGIILTARGAKAEPLYATGLAVAIAPILVVLAVFGTGADAAAPWRGYGLVAAAWLLLALGVLLGRGAPARAPRLRALRVPTLAVAITAGAAGMVQGVRFGLGADTIDTGGIPIILFCFGIGLAGAIPAAAAARVIRSSAEPGSRLARTRWLYAPAAVYIAVATWSAIERDWFTIWAMWALMLAYLVTLVLVAWRLRPHAVRPPSSQPAEPSGSRPTGFPPVWFIFAIAFVTSIVAWSPRDLRVEWFSLPLGLFLLAAGAIVLRTVRAHPDIEGRTGGAITAWPTGWTSSWALLGPGIVVTMLASIISTFTDPLTWRAILVIVIALIAILIGSSLKLAAPFLIGIIVLPIENVFVFLVQIGRGIESMPWWITLAVVGAVLLIIAVTYERRAGEANSITARLRDLR